MGAELFSSTIFYCLLFLSMYVQVFLLVTFLENRKKIVRRTGAIELASYSGVTVIVPCWNEEKTIDRTVQSLLNLDYPKDKLHIFLIDDGSTDGTWNVMQRYIGNSQIEVFQKSNGGKHTAMNMGIERATTDFISCLDADSFVDTHALKRIMSYFSNPKVMAVAPSILIYKPKSIFQIIQKAEYDWAVYIKKMLAFLGGIHVTPGPFSVYRKEIFTHMGLFRKAHNTEDMEIAFRMQRHHFKIEQCNDAYVYTVAPSTFYKLYKQRLRWIYGFIMNTVDYRDMLFKKEYGTFSFFTVPSGIVSIIAVPYVLARLLYKLVLFIRAKIMHVQAVGFHTPSTVHFDWFFVNTQSLLFFVVILYALVISAMLIGRKMAEGKTKFSFSMVSFMAIYSVIAPVWIMKAIYNAIVGKKTTWR